MDSKIIKLNKTGGCVLYGMAGNSIHMMRIMVANENKTVLLILNPKTHLNIIFTCLRREKMREINNKIVTQCFDSLAIRLQTEDLKHLIPRPGLPGLQG